MYRTVAASFWTDPKVKQLSFEGKGLLLYYITNPHTHVSGIYVLPKAIIQHETSLAKSKLDTLCHTLSSLRFCAFDDSKDVVWVRKMMAYQGKGEKNLRSAAAHVAEDLHNSFLCKQFLDTYPDVRPFIKPSFIDTLCNTPSDTVSEFGTPDSRSRFPIPEQENRTGDAALPPVKRGFGEFGSVKLTEAEHGKLLEKLNSHLPGYIDRLDRYSQNKPRDFAKYKSHYATLLTWFDRDVKEGKVGLTKVTSRPSEDEMDRLALEMFGRKAK